MSETIVPARPGVFTPLGENADEPVVDWGPPQREKAHDYKRKATEMYRETRSEFRRDVGFPAGREYNIAWVVGGHMIFVKLESSRGGVSTQRKVNAFSGATLTVWTRYPAVTEGKLHLWSTDGDESVYVDPSSCDSTKWVMSGQLEFDEAQNVFSLLDSIDEHGDRVIEEYLFPHLPDYAGMEYIGEDDE